MFVFHLLEDYRPLEPIDSDHLIREVTAIPILAFTIEFSTPQAVFVQGTIAGFPSPSGHRFADMCDAGVRSKSDRSRFSSHYFLNS